MIGSQAETRNVPARDVAKFKGAARGHDLRQRRAAGVSSAENAAHTGAGNVRDGDVIFFKNLQHAEMREAASKSSAKRKGHTRPRKMASEERVALERCAAAENCVDEAMVLR